MKAFHALMVGMGGGLVLLTLILEVFSPSTSIKDHTSLATYFASTSLPARNISSIPSSKSKYRKDFPETCLMHWERLFKSAVPAPFHSNQIANAYRVQFNNLEEIAKTLEALASHKECQGLAEFSNMFRTNYEAKLYNECPRALAQWKVKNRNQPHTTDPFGFLDEVEYSESVSAETCLTDVGRYRFEVIEALSKNKPLELINNIDILMAKLWSRLNFAYGDGKEILEILNRMVEVDPWHPLARYYRLVFDYSLWFTQYSHAGKVELSTKEKLMESIETIRLMHSDQYIPFRAKVAESFLKTPMSSHQDREIANLWFQFGLPVGPSFEPAWKSFSKGDKVGAFKKLSTELKFYQKHLKDPLMSGHLSQHAQKTWNPHLTLNVEYTTSSDISIPYRAWQGVGLEGRLTNIKNPYK